MKDAESVLCVLVTLNQFVLPVQMAIEASNTQTLGAQVVTHLQFAHLAQLLVGATWVFVVMDTADTYAKPLKLKERGGAELEFKHRLTTIAWAVKLLLKWCLHQTPAKL
jgi:hypothetical protein